MVIRDGDKHKIVTICNGCRAEQAERKGWTKSGAVDYCPKCSEKLVPLVRFQNKLARP